MNVGVNPVSIPPMKLGIGSEEHSAVLRLAGAERVLYEDEFAVAMQSLGFSIRPDDTLIVLNPHIIDKKDLVQIAAQGTHVQVVGNEPILCNNEARRAEFRAQRHLVDGVPPLENKGGRPAKLQPTMQQSLAISSLWHDRRIMPRIVAERVSDIMGHEVSVADIKNLMVRLHGHNRRGN